MRSFFSPKQAGKHERKLSNIAKSGMISKLYLFLGRKAAKSQAFMGPHSRKIQQQKTLGRLRVFETLDKRMIWLF